MPVPLRLGRVMRSILACFVMACRQTRQIDRPAELECSPCDRHSDLEHRRRESSQLSATSAMMFYGASIELGPGSLSLKKQVSPLEASKLAVQEFKDALEPA
jgi:hypothetical protein